jgi:hypothetical protein
MLTEAENERLRRLVGKVRDRVALAPHYFARQREALEAIERLRSEGHAVPKLLYGGAKAGGKSYFGCRYAVQLAEEHPGIRGYLCRAEAVTFKRTTLMTMLSPAPDGVDVLSRPGWTHRLSDQCFTHENGSRLDYGGIAANEDREKVKSMNITFAFVDEASDTDQLSTRMLESQCNRQADFTSFACALYTSNPEPCWLQADFIDNPRPGRAFVQSLPSDNRYLPQGYLEHMAETYADMPELLDAYLHGSWSALGGMDSVFPHSLLMAACNREGDATGDRQWGVDVARFGDDHTVVYERVGTSRPVKLAEWSKQDTRMTSDKLVALYHAAANKPKVIAVDDIGLGGGVTDNLKAEKLPVRPINVGEAAKESDKFVNKRAEVAWHLRVVLEAGGSLPDDAGLRAELGAMKWFPRSGRIAVTPKEDLKKSLGRSPDHADALILSFAPGPVVWSTADILAWGGITEEEKP